MVDFAPPIAAANTAPTGSPVGSCSSAPSDTFHKMLAAVASTVPAGKPGSQPASQPAATPETESTKLAALAGLMLAQVNPNLLSSMAAPLITGQAPSASATDTVTTSGVIEADLAAAPGALLTGALQTATPTLGALETLLSGATQPTQTGGDKPAQVEAARQTGDTASPPQPAPLSALDALQAAAAAQPAATGPTAPGGPKLNLADLGSSTAPNQPTPALDQTHGQAQKASETARLSTTGQPALAATAAAAGRPTATQTPVPVPDPAATGQVPSSTGVHTLELARSAEAQTVRPSAAPVSDLVRQMSAAIGSAVRDGPGSMRVQLYPDELGHIDLRLTTDAAGMHVVLTADRPATASLLGQRLDELQSALTSSGVSLAGVSVGAGNTGGAANGAAGGWSALNGAPGWGLRGQPDDAQPPAAEEARPAFGASNGSRVDYWI